ncbi:hypothetical protein [Limosilactobacillus reuteri]|uniref:hypothetical protein n=1 Tax=Limosilactobacillus reuteri TaxID=1598 RepID=UPI00128E0CBB|nr:hypothetical protein [Limosilactobacillus reuteri]MQB69914.1 hypothetical protein [Limosilactobacillus reuteri]MQC05261.1 hypothetical protein [Limosilactobacillus reuteri]
MLTNQIEKKLKDTFEYNLFSKKSAIEVTKNIISAEQLDDYLFTMIDRNILTSFEDIPGVYQFTKINNDLGIPITIKATRDELVEYLYLDNNTGYVYGNSVLKNLGLSTQMPQEEYIATKRTSKMIIKDIENYTYNVKPVKIKSINKENIRLLQIIDTLLLPGILSDDGETKERILEKLVTFALSTLNSFEEVTEITSNYSRQEEERLEDIGFFDEVDKQQSISF